MLDFLVNINTLQAVLLILGILFLLVEIFNPGFGIPGIIGLVLLVTGIIITSESLTDALVLVVIIMVIIGGALFLAIRSAKKGRLSKNVILNDALNKESGFSSSEDLTAFKGKEGIAVTTLRPAGIGEFDDTKLNVVTEGDFIKAGTQITIKNVVGNRVIVKEIKK